MRSGTGKWGNLDRFEAKGERGVPEKFRKSVLEDASGGRQQSGKGPSVKRREPLESVVTMVLNSSIRTRDQKKKEEGKSTGYLPGGRRKSRATKKLD